MVENRKWIFNDYCKPLSPIGVLLMRELIKIPVDIGNEERRKKALENLGDTIGCEIKPNDFLALGTETYLSEKKEVCEGILSKIDELKAMRRR